MNSSTKSTKNTKPMVGRRCCAAVNMGLRSSTALPVLLAFLVFFVSFVDAHSAEAVTLIPSLAPRQCHVVISSAGWTDRQSFLDHSAMLASVWTNCPEWTPHAGAWRISACWAPEATSFEVVEPNIVRISPQQWFTAVSAAGLAGAEFHVVVVNSMAWAASTAQRLYLTRNPDVAILRHEMFHLIAGCADEYSAPYNWADAWNPRTPNLAASRLDLETKWGHLIATGVIGEPVQDAAGWFRPTAEDCILRNPHRPACAVCFRAQRNAYFEFIGQPIPEERPRLTSPIQTLRLVAASNVLPRVLAGSSDLNGSAGQEPRQHTFPK